MNRATNPPNPKDGEIIVRGDTSFYGLSWGMTLVVQHNSVSFLRGWRERHDDDVPMDYRWPLGVDLKWFKLCVLTAVESGNIQVGTFKTRLAPNSHRVRLELHYRDDVRGTEAYFSVGDRDLDNLLAAVRKNFGLAAA